MSRQSVWPSAPPPSDHLDYLEDCISTTEGCVQSLSGALVRLEPGIRDFPRLTKVFTNQHVRPVVHFVSFSFFNSVPVLPPFLIFLGVNYGRGVLRIFEASCTLAVLSTDNLAIPSLTPNNDPNRNHNSLTRTRSSDR